VLAAAQIAIALADGIGAKFLGWRDGEAAVVDRYGGGSWIGSRLGH